MNIEVSKLLCSITVDHAVVCSAVDNMCEIEPDFLRFDEILGEGQFGDVYRGTYTALVCNFCTYSQQLIYHFIELFGSHTTSTSMP